MSAILSGIAPTFNMLPRLLAALCAALTCANLALAQGSQTNSTGIKLQNGFERVFIQVCILPIFLF